MVKRYASNMEKYIKKDGEWKYYFKNEFLYTIPKNTYIYQWLELREACVKLKREFILAAKKDFIRIKNFIMSIMNK